jgi:hypothetical protein
MIFFVLLLTFGIFEVTLFMWGFGFRIFTRWQLGAVAFWFCIVFWCGSRVFFTCLTWFHAEADLVWLWKHVWFDFFLSQESNESIEQRDAVGL